MVKLNKKGYLAVEVILASVVAVSIAVFLIDLTVKMVNKTNDNYTNTLFLTDKALITNHLRKEIKQDMKNNSGLNSAGIKNGSCYLEYNNGSGKRINISKDEENRDAIITYSPGYSKTINKDIKYSSIYIDKCGVENNYLIIKINFEDIFTTNNNRDIEIVLYNSTK